MAPWLITGAIALAKEFIPSMVGKVAGDKSGQVAEKVIDVAADASGVDIRSSDDVGKAAQTIRANPDLTAKVSVRLAELEQEELKAYLGDRQSARSRDVELARAGEHNWRADAMVIGAFVAVTVIAVFLIMTDELSEAVLGFVTTIGGMLMKNISTAFDFEFGSSRSSKNKSVDMGRLLAGLGRK